MLLIWWWWSWNMSSLNAHTHFPTKIREVWWHKCWLCDHRQHLFFWGDYSDFLYSWLLLEAFKSHYNLPNEGHPNREKIIWSVKQRVWYNVPLTNECQAMVLVQYNRRLLLVFFSPVCNVGKGDALLQEQVLLLFLRVHVLRRPAQLSALHLVHLRELHNDGG